MRRRPPRGREAAVGLISRRKVGVGKREGERRIAATGSSVASGERGEREKVNHFFAGDIGVNVDPADENNNGLNLASNQEIAASSAERGGGSKIIRQQTEQQQRQKVKRFQFTKVLGFLGITQTKHWKFLLSLARIPLIMQQLGAKVGLYLCCSCS